MKLIGEFYILQIISSLEMFTCGFMEGKYYDG